MSYGYEIALGALVGALVFAAGYLAGREDEREGLRERVRFERIEQMIERSELMHQDNVQRFLTRFERTL